MEASPAGAVADQGEQRVQQAGVSGDVAAALEHLDEGVVDQVLGDIGLLGQAGQRPLNEEGTVGRRRVDVADVLDDLGNSRTARLLFPRPTHSSPSLSAQWRA
jgi:hypothetical protein